MILVRDATALPTILSSLVVGHWTHYNSGGMPQSIPALHSNTGIHYISSISISMLPLDICTAPACQRQMSKVVISHIWLRLVGSWGVGLLLLFFFRRHVWWRGWWWSANFGCWLVDLCRSVCECQTEHFERQWFFIQEAAVPLVDRPCIWDAQVKNVFKPGKVLLPWFLWGLIHVYYHVREMLIYCWYDILYIIDIVRYFSVSLGLV